MSNAPQTARLSSLLAAAMRDRDSDERLRQIVDRHFALASRIIRNLGIPDGDVDDVLQQAFSITSDRLPDIEVGKERAFLIQTAIHLAGSARRARALSRETLTDELPEVSDGRPSPEDLSDHARALRVLDGVLGDMDLELRSVFVLYEVEEMTMSEIAAVLQIPAGTVASRLRRAREDFLARVHRTRVAKARKEGRS